MQRFPIVAAVLALQSCAPWKASPLVSIGQPGIKLHHVGETVTTAIVARCSPNEGTREEVCIARFDRKGVMHTRNVTRRGEDMGYDVRFSLAWRF